MNRFVLQVVGFGAFLCFEVLFWVFSFSFGLALCPQETKRISNYRKWSLLSKQEHIPGQMLAQAVAVSCLRDTFVLDQPLTLTQMMRAQFSSRGVFPSLGHFRDFCRIAVYFPQNPQFPRKLRQTIVQR